MAFVAVCFKTYIQRKNLCFANLYFCSVIATFMSQSELVLHCTHFITQVTMVASVFPYQMVVWCSVVGAFHFR